MTSLDKSLVLVATLDKFLVLVSDLEESMDCWLTWRESLGTGR